MSSTGEETATAARAATGGLPDILIRAGPRLGAPPRPPPIGPRPPASFHSEAPESVLPLPPYPVSFCMSASDMSFLSLYTYYAPARPLKIAANRHASPCPVVHCPHARLWLRSVAVVSFRTSLSTYQPSSARTPLPPVRACSGSVFNARRLGVAHCRHPRHFRPTYACTPAPRPA